MALDDQLLLAVTTSVASATFLVGFLGNQFHRTLDFARTAAARDDDEALRATGSGLSAIVERQEREFERSRGSFPLDWVWLGVVAAIAVGATSLAVAAAVAPEQPASSSDVWTVVTLVALVWLVALAAAWDWRRTARELVRVRHSTYASVLVELRDHLASWKRARAGVGDPREASGHEADAIRHRVGATRMARLLIARLPRSGENALGALARGWAACALVAQAHDIGEERMAGEETQMTRHGGVTAAKLAFDLATDALAELYESISALAEAAPPALLTAAAWAVEAACDLEPPPSRPESMPDEWDAWCLAEASWRRRDPAVRLDPASGPPADPIVPSWRVYDRALRRQTVESKDIRATLHLLDELIGQVDAITSDANRARARSATIGHIQALIPKVAATDPHGVETALTYLWKWPFVTTPSGGTASGSWLNPVAEELRDRYLAVDERGAR